MKTIVIVTNIPNPYRIPLFNELAIQLKKADLCLHVIFAKTNYHRRKFKLDMSDCLFEYTVLNSSVIENANEEKIIFSYSNLITHLNEIKPACIVVGGYSPATLKIWWYGMRNKIPFIIWSGSVLPKGGKDKFLRSLQRKFLTARASSFVAYGSLAKEYLIGLGAKKEKVEIGINTVDTAFFASESSRLRLQNTTSPKKHLTFIGYLVPRKNVVRLLEIMKLLAHKRNDIILDLVGDGDDRPALEQFVAENNLHELVQFHGFKQKSELPYYLSKTDLFLFQTDFDIWGLTLVEAMAAGITCLSSIHAGANMDLIIDGETGFRINFADTEMAANKINHLLDHPAELNRIGMNAANFIENHVNLSVSANGFVTAIRNCIN